MLDQTTDRKNYQFCQTTFSLLNFYKLLPVITQSFTSLTLFTLLSYKHLAISSATLHINGLSLYTFIHLYTSIFLSILFIHLFNSPPSRSPTRLVTLAGSARPALLIGCDRRALQFFGEICFSSQHLHQLLRL